MSFQRDISSQIKHPLILDHSNEKGRIGTCVNFFVMEGKQYI